MIICIACGVMVCFYDLLEGEVDGLNWKINWIYLVFQEEKISGHARLWFYYVAGLHKTSF